MNRVDIVIDIETLSLINTPVIVQFSGVAFDIKTGNILDQFDYHIDFEEQIENTLENKSLLNKYNVKYDESKLGIYDFFTISENTLDFWSKQPKDIRDKVLYHSDRIKIKEALNKFESFINKYIKENEVYCWSNGLIYDINMIARLYEKFSGNLFDFPIFHTKLRDVRTIVDVASMKENITYKEFLNKVKGYNHDALSDSIYEAKIMHEAYKTLIEK